MGTIEPDQPCPPVPTLPRIAGSLAAARDRPDCAKHWLAGGLKTATGARTVSRMIPRALRRQTARRIAW
jgi:hypothetical protein